MVRFSFAFTEQRCSFFIAGLEILRLISVFFWAGRWEYAEDPRAWEEGYCRVDWAWAGDRISAVAYGVVQWLVAGNIENTFFFFLGCGAVVTVRAVGRGASGGFARISGVFQHVP